MDETPGFDGWARNVREPKSGVVFLLVAPDSFQMGSPIGEEGRDPDEKQHLVTLTKAFYLAETETTQEQYKRVTGDDPSGFKGANLPVESIDWDQARAFCQEIGCDLPTEAQWEFACRAGTTSPFSFGGTISASQVNHDATFVYGDGRKGKYREKSAPVKSYPANAWGLFEMHGNVWEWCLDRAPSDYQTLPSKDPVRVQGASRVLRGGSWSGSPGGCRSAYRRSGAPSIRSNTLGFRAARTLP